MNLKILLLLMIVSVFLVGFSEAAKGGAKSVINRNRRQRNRGGHGFGGNHGDDLGDGLGGGPVTGMGDFDKGPCVGVCYYIKKRGIKIDSSMKARMKRRRPCIGLCHLKKKKERKRKVLKKENEAPTK